MQYLFAQISLILIVMHAEFYCLLNSLSCCKVICNFTFQYKITRINLWTKSFVNCWPPPLIVGALIVLRIIEQDMCTWLTSGRPSTLREKYGLAGSLLE